VSARLQERSQGAGARTVPSPRTPSHTSRQGKPEDAAAFLLHSGALVKPACCALSSRQPRLCVLGMQARLHLLHHVACRLPAAQLVMHLSNAAALLPPHCAAIAPLLKDARDGLDEGGNLKFLQLLSALFLLPAFVSQAQCSAAGESSPPQHRATIACVCSDAAPAALSVLLPLHKERNPVIGQTAAAIAVMAVQSVVSAAASSGDTAAALSLIGAPPLPPLPRTARNSVDRRLHSARREPGSSCPPMCAPPLRAEAPPWCRFPSGLP
jgi:hypothetical protein